MQHLLVWGNVLAVVMAIVLNYLANNLSLNGNTVGGVSAQYANLFTPAGYAFAIWGLIYLGQLALSIYLVRQQYLQVHDDYNALQQLQGWLILANLLNAAWIFAWLYEYTGLSVLLIIGILLCLLKIYLNTQAQSGITNQPYIYFFWWPITWYFGWVSVAAIANIAVWFTKLGWQGEPLSPVAWAVIMLLIAAGLNFFMTWVGNARMFAWVGVWAILAIGVNRLQDHPGVAATSFVLAGLLTINNVIHAFKTFQFLPEVGRY